MGWTCVTQGEGKKIENFRYKTQKAQLGIRGHMFCDNIKMAQRDGK
jgi:hypothetical protein